MNFYIGLDVMVIKLWPLDSKLTNLYFALWARDFTDRISPWSACSLLGFIDENTKDWKERQKIDFFFGLIPVCFCTTPNTTFHSGCNCWIQEQQLALVFVTPLTPPNFRTTSINSPHRHQQYSLGLLKPVLKDLILLGGRGAPQTFWVWESVVTSFLLRALSPRWTGTYPSF